MPDATATPLLGHLRAQALAAGVGLALAAALTLPSLLGCWWGGAEAACHNAQAGQVLTNALLLWGLLAAAQATQRWLPTEPVARRRGLAVQIVALAVASLLAVALFTDFDIQHYTVQINLTLSACICVFVELHGRQRRRQADAQRLHQDEQALSRQLDEARAQMLQAQVEPHFIFNTLAHLRRLAQTDPPGAHAMLGDLLRYLEAALPSLRTATSTLAHELSLVGAFLALHQRRIGAQRLRLRTEIAPGLGTLIVPSTCLLTLAENAVKHGITPQVAGGEIVVSAGPDPDDASRLLLAVADTGPGMGASTGSGTGLVTLQGRLAAAYGPAASLSLRLNSPQGLVAQLRLPRQMPAEPAERAGATPMRGAGVAS